MPLTRVQLAYLRHAANTTAEHVTTPAIQAAAERDAADWPERLTRQLVTDLHGHRVVAESAGVDFTRLPIAPPGLQPASCSPADGQPPTHARGQADPITVPDEMQLRLSAEILTAPAGLDPLVFDTTIDSLRAVPVSDLNEQLTSTTVSRLEEGGLSTVFDVLATMPRTYIDRSTLTPLAAAEPGHDITTTGVVISISRRITHTTKLVQIRIADGSARITATFFNAMWMADRFNDRDLVVLQGTTREFNGHLQMDNPIIERVEDSSSILVPIYPQSTIRDISTGKRDKALTTTMLRSAAIAALQRIPTLDDPLPADLVKRRHLMSRRDALRAIHVPDSAAHAAAGRARLAYDELLRLQLALGVIRNIQAAAPGISHRPTGKLVHKWSSNLPYALTGAQQRAIAEIRADLVAPAPMNRLTQGDVGSGKTAVMTAAALMAIEGGHQACLMAPTELLARQHFTELAESLEPLGITVDLLVSKHLPRPRKQVMSDLAAGDTNLLIGTHSLLSPAVTFNRLGLAMIDEQHRFGVDQRALLMGKGPHGIAPDVLQATATPIPRTSAITTYGDMAVTVLDEKPAGRVDVATQWIPSVSVRDPNGAPWRHIRSQVAQGRQAFIVCSRVSAGSQQSETQDAAAATEAAELLAQHVFADQVVAVTHGKQKPDERAHIMGEFKDGGIDILVATTVIEVGVSVPNATVMVILDANRFGIAQLHQIRGRVGRGKHRGYCWLVCEGNNDDTTARMTAMTTTNDGFQLAEMDLQIRGAGALTGTEQSGHDAGLRVADLLKDNSIHLAARADARQILAGDPQLQRHLTLRREVDLALGEDAAYLTRG